MAAVVGALRVVLGADTAAFDKAMKDAAGTAKSFGKAMSEVAAGIQLQKFIDGMVSAFGRLAVSSLNTGESLSKMSQKIGVPVEELSKLRVAAVLSDLTLEEFGKSVVKLSKTLVEASKNPFSEAADAFQALSISVKDASGNLKTNDQLLEELADRFASFKDSAEKTALALAIFGKAGASMIPFLNQGAEGIRKAREEAVKFGLAIDTVTAKAAEEFNDNLKRVNLIMEGLVTQITAHMLPAMNAFTNNLLEVANNAELTTEAAKGITEFLKFAISGFAQAALFVARFTAQLAASLLFLQQVGKALITVGLGSTDVAGAMKRVAEEEAKTEAQSAKLKEILDKLFAGVFGEAEKTTGAIRTLETQMTQTAAAAQRAGVIMQDSQTAPTIRTDEMRAKAKQLQDQIKALGVEAQVLRGRFDQFAPGFAQAANSFKMFGDVGKLSLASMSKEARDLNFNMLQVSALKLTDANSEFATTQQHIMALDAAMKSGKLSVEQMGIATELSGKLQLKTWQLVGAGVADFFGSMSQLAAVFGKENKEMAIAAKAFGIAQAIINTQVGITKALTLPFPMNWIQAAAVTAAGAAAVATIVAQKMATGGSFIVPGAGAVDSTFVPIMATPGERVTVETPEQQRRGSGEGQTIILQGNSFHITEVRDLFEVINAGLRDGHRFKVIGAPA